MEGSGPSASEAVAEQVSKVNPSMLSEGEMERESMLGDELLMKMKPVADSPFPSPSVGVAVQVMVTMVQVK